MRFTIDVGKDPDIARVKKERKEASKVLKKYKRVARRVRVTSFFKIVYYYLRYSKLYKYERPELQDLIKVLDTPEKVYAYTKRWVTLKDGNEVTELEDIVKTGISTDKGLCAFIAIILHKHHYKSYILWLGYSGDKIMPVSAVMLRQYELTIGPTYKVHTGGKDEILHDYFPDGNRWIMLDRDLEGKIVDFDEGRTPQYVIWDEDWLLELTGPNTFEAYEKMKNQQVLKQKLPVVE